MNGKQNLFFKLLRVKLLVCRREKTTTVGFSDKEIDNSKKWLENFKHDDIPKNLFEISYSRSSGPGGQNVNKTSSKATVKMDSDKWLNPRFCYWIPPPILSQIKVKRIKYETKSGALLIQSDSTRNSKLNFDDCFKKFLDSIKKNVYFEEINIEDQKKLEEKKKENNEKRLFEKKKQSDKKKTRSKLF